MTNGICGNEFQPSLRDSSLCASNPALKRRAIFGCPCGTKFRRRKPRVEKLERFVNFKPQTPLREIIRLTAGESLVIVLL